MKILKKLINKFSRNKNHLQYEGPFETWREAKDKSIGYESDVVLKKVQQAVINVLDGSYKYERDGTNFESLPPKNTLIDELNKEFFKNQTILDIGGGLGSLYINYKDIFSSAGVNYIVLEQRNFCEVGKEIANKYHLDINFIDNIDDLTYFDLVIISSTLQYFEKWDEFVKKVISKNPKNILIDRHPLSSKESKIFIQLNTNYYESEVTYPIHIVNQEKFENEFKDYKIKKFWNSDFDPEYFKGYHFIK